MRTFAHPALNVVLLLLVVTILQGCSQPIATDLSGFTYAGSLTVTCPTCEGQVNALAIDSPSPRLGWILTANSRGQYQSAYRVLVASSPEILADGRGDLWDSGKIAGSQTLNVAYAGRPLVSGQTCYWKVRSWDQGDRPSQWGPTSRWEMALLQESDWRSMWLNDGRVNPSTSESVFAPDPAPLFRKEFSLVKALKRARLHISGLGYYEASLNGHRVGDHVLDPGWTAYDHRVLYSTYDVTDQVRSGANCLGVTLGNGWYNPLPLRMWGRLNLRESLAIGRPRFIARLTLDFTDGTSQAVVSDQSWKVGEGPIRFNNIYLGEIYDARMERAGWDSPGFDDSAWHKPAIATERVGPLEPQSQPPIRVTERITTMRVTEPKPGVFIYDMGQNFSGWATLRIEKPLLAPGTTINLRYGELLNADGTLNPMTSVAGQIKGSRKSAAGVDESVGGPGVPPIAWQRDEYITRGTPSADDGTETWTPRFTFHAFRYVEVTGLPAGSTAGRVTLTGLRLNSDVADAGSFECSNELFNQIQLMCRRTFLANIFSVQSDCPHRERFGYGGDINATSEAFTLNFDMSGFYAKAARDIADAARPDGLFTDTAPFVGIQYCGVGWAMAHPLLLTQLRREYGDERLMVEQYDASRKWLLKVAHDYPGGLITDGLSDHETLEESPVPQMVTPLWVQSAQMLEDMARVLHKDQDAAEFDAIGDVARTAYLKAFPPTTSKSTQASLAFALYSELVPEKTRGAVLGALIANIQGKQGHLTTGILGTKYMLDQLSRGGHADVAYAMVNRRDFPGWGWMLENSATTLWEHWELSDNTYSHSHPMFGSVSQWFFNWLGGIQPAADAVGYDSIVIRPQMVKGLDWVRSSHRTVRGMIVSNWKREAGGVRMDIEIPVGSTAFVYVPAQRPEQISESGVTLVPSAQVAGVELLRTKAGEAAPDGCIVYVVGSGKYSFIVKR